MGFYLLNWWEMVYEFVLVFFSFYYTNEPIGTWFGRARTTIILNQVNGIRRMLTMVWKWKKNNRLECIESVDRCVCVCGDMWKCMPLMHLFSNKPEACFIISYFMSLIRIIARKSDSFLLNFNKLIGKTHDWYSI